MRAWVRGRFSRYDENENIKNFFIRDINGKELEVSLEGSIVEIYTELEGKLISIKNGMVQKTLLKCSDELRSQIEVKID